MNKRKKGRKKSRSEQIFSASWRICTEKQWQHMPGSISEPPSWKQSVHHVLGCPLSSGCCCQSCLNSLHFKITVYARNRSVTLHNSKLLANCVKGSCKEPSEQFTEESLPGGRWRTITTSQYAIQREHMTCQGHMWPLRQSNTLSLPTLLWHWHSFASNHTELTLHV